MPTSGSGGDADDEFIALTGTDKIRAQNHRLLAQIAHDYLRERKSIRRWRMVKSIALGAFTGLVLVFVFADPPSSGFAQREHTALVDINGVISFGAENADQINYSLQRAFAAENSAGVVLRINSPGGSPVQAAQVNQEIRRLRAKYPDKPFYAVISDICTSGGYYIAVAAEQIFADPASLVGSIGVRLDGFGFVESMEKLGIERRLLTAGKDKGILDPFLPQDPAQVDHMQAVLRQVHSQFIAAVKRGRGVRLVDNPDLFSGLFWSGEQAQELGLIDEFGSLESVARDVIGAERVVDYSAPTPLLEQFAEHLGGAIFRVWQVWQRSAVGLH